VQSLPVVVLGFLLGMLHATDADHVVAMSAVVVRQRSVGSAARVGFFWGLGHTVTVFSIGSAIILFNLAISTRLEQAMEFCVALMLVLLGILTLSRMSRQVHESVTPSLAQQFSAPAQAAAFAGKPTSPAPPPRWLVRQVNNLGRYPALRPFGIGIVHGLAGSAAVALLVLTQIHEPAWAVAYLLLFGVGTTAGMMLTTLVIAIPFLRLGRLPLLGFGMQVLAGALSLGLGCYLAFRLGVVDGLFSLP
jgi:high-affinity nickel-transport protein